jgi:hypothetical protein
MSPYRSGAPRIPIGPYLCARVEAKFSTKRNVTLNVPDVSVPDMYALLMAKVIPVSSSKGGACGNWAALCPCLVATLHGRQNGTCHQLSLMEKTLVSDAEVVAASTNTVSNGAS